MRETERIAWHPGFCGAIELELRENKNELTFVPEYLLSKEPLRADMMVIEKMPDAQIHNEIGKIFRTYNLFEYKSPGDAMGIDEYAKALAYVCLYKSEAKKANERPFEELSMTMVRDEMPKSLIEQLQKLGNTIEEVQPGIFRVEGKVLFPTQIIVSSRLRAESHASLRILSRNARKIDIEDFLRQAKAYKDKDDLQNVDALLQVSVVANRKLYDEMKESDPIMCEALKDLMRDEIRAEVDHGKVMTLVAAVKGIKEVFGVDNTKALEAANVPAEYRAEVLAAL